MLCLLFVSNAYAQDLALPKEILGYWRPYSDDLYTDFNVMSNGIIKRSFVFGKKERLLDIPYKVLKIEGNKAFLIIRDGFTEAERKRVPDLPAKPWYSYMILERKRLADINHPFLSVTILNMKDDVTDKDWSAPTVANKKRIENDQSPYGPRSTETYTRDE